MVDRRISPAEQQTVERLRRGLSEAVLVERATGVLMHRDACSPRAARARLAGEALAAGRPLAEHATAVLAAAERGPIGPPGRLSHGTSRSPATGRPVRERVVTADPEEAAERLGRTYRTRVRLWPPQQGLPDGAVFRLTHTDIGHFRVCDDWFPGELSLVSDAAAQLVVAELVAGRAERRAPGSDERLAAGDVFLTGHPATPHAGCTVDAHLRIVVLPLPLLHRIHGGGPDSAAPLRFTSLRPATPELGRQWRATAAYVGGLLERGEVPPPLLTAQAANLLAATALAVFPNSWSERAPTAGAGGPASLTVRRAASYLEEHARQDVTVADVAEAVHVTPRALQYAFRRHLDTTPLGYLRDVRLRHAHEDLLAADPASDTVTRIAARWGFQHPGRFAASYRDRYRCPPGDTLREV